MIQHLHLEARRQIKDNYWSLQVVAVMGCGDSVDEDVHEEEGEWMQHSLSSLIPVCLGLE